MADDGTSKEKRPVSDLARETRRQNAIRMNQKKKEAKKQAHDDEDPVVDMIRRIVDERIEEKLNESRSGSNVSAIALLLVQLLANSSIVPSILSKLTKNQQPSTSSEPPSTGLDQWLNAT